MPPQLYSGLFVAEGTSDAPLADIVELLFLQHGVHVNLSRRDFAPLKVAKDVGSRVAASLTLIGNDVDLIVVHRDADNAGHEARLHEIEHAVRSLSTSACLVPVIPVRMTEAWLLLDEAAIRHVAGNPNGRAPLSLPRVRDAEAVADPKSMLAECILTAANVSGRRRDRLAKRFGQSRGQLLERLDLDGPIAELRSWKHLTAQVAKICDHWQDAGG